jgi:hypothetical protein
MFPISLQDSGVVNMDNNYVKRPNEQVAKSLLEGDLLEVTKNQDHLSATVELKEKNAVFIEQSK